MKHGVRVRAATPADIEIVVALRLALIAEQSDSPLYQPLRADAPARARRLFGTQLSSRRESTFLAFDGETCVGILRCVAAPPSPLFDHQPHGYMTSAFVIPRARRRGVLRALVNAAEEWGARQGLGELRLHSMAGSEQADGAWSALGFGVVEQLRRRVIPAGRAQPVAPPPAPGRQAAKPATPRAAARRSTP